MSNSANTPVVLIHGWAGSYRETWEKPGINALLEDVGRTVLGIDLLGHGDAEKPHDPNAYEHLDTWLLDQLPPDRPVDVVAFSLGALTTLSALVAAPHRFRRVVLAGIGDGVFHEADPARAERIIAGMEGRADETDTFAALFRQYGHTRGNDTAALIAVLKRPRQSPLARAQLSAIANDVTVVIGDKDFAGPADELATSFPNGRLVTLRNTDHFATPESFPFIDAVLEVMSA
jgi:pimeloyl-ACP methyl ester carboxylesterase